MALNASPDPRRAGSRPGRRFLDNLWYAASSSQLTIALAVLLAFTFALAAAISQVPPGLEPAASGLWLSAASARFGRFGTFLSSAGLFTLLDSPWVKALLSAVAFHLILRVANQAFRLFRRTTPGIPPAPQGLPFELVHSRAPLAAMQSRVEAVLGDEGRGRVVSSCEDLPRPRVDAFSERRTWAAIGPLLTYLGPLLVLGGLVWNSMEGWRASDITLTAGIPEQPAHARGTTLTLVDAGGSGEELPAVLGLTRGTTSSNFWLSYGRPVIWNGTWVVQRASGPALSVRAETEGRSLSLQPLDASSGLRETLHLRFDQNESEQGFTIPGRSLAFRIVSYESLPDRGITGPVFLVEGYRGNDTTPQLSELVEETGAIDWEGVTLALQRDRYVVVDLAAIPGWPLMLLGGLVLLAGVGVTAWAGITRAWINAATDRDGTLLAVRVAAPARGQDLVSRIAAALAAGEDSATDKPAAGQGALFEAWQASKVLRLSTTAILLAGAALLAALSYRAVAAFTTQAHSWTFILRNALAGAGLAAWIPATVASFWWAVRSGAPGEAVDPLLPPDAHGMRGRTGDPGRGVALVAFPLFTAALLAGGIWNLLAFAAPWRAVAGELWVLSAWCMAVAYLHATSGWRPLRVPVWLAVALAAATLAAGVAAALSAASLFQ